MNRSTAFDYPATPHIRRHGPFGYDDPESYREWLRDDFCFRCVFCLRRERWGPRAAAFNVEHLIPNKVDQSLVCVYGNLFYACARCNAVKNDRRGVPDPTKVAFGQCVRVHSDGDIESLNETGEVFVDLLALNSPDLIAYRKLLLDTWQRLGQTDLAYNNWMRFPDDLPDLSRKEAPGNSRPEGIAHSWFALRARGELPEIY
jgi:hypothetical protein